MVSPPAAAMDSSSGGGLTLPSGSARYSPWAFKHHPQLRSQNPPKGHVGQNTEVQWPLCRACSSGQVDPVECSTIALASTQALVGAGAGAMDGYGVGCKAGVAVGEVGTMVGGRVGDGDGIAVSGVGAGVCVGA